MLMPGWYCSQLISYLSVLIIYQHTQLLELSPLWKPLTHTSTDNRKSRDSINHCQKLAWGFNQCFSCRTGMEINYLSYSRGIKNTTWDGDPTDVKENSTYLEKKVKQFQYFCYSYVRTVLNARYHAKSTWVLYNVTILSIHQKHNQSVALIHSCMFEK